ncbi:MULTISPECIES: VirB3 family type IV secretion system protein [unclassified Mesorhizobium]|uniref:VirB3 family type IV secretion system protein n=1 Tax=unclassified Mesorhizobium TaxID=325217 RepID=UPI000F7537BA|nr:MULTISPECIES: VirB3 family type IV secretion system protein [unclassified Mesorhizobium]AZO32468.1 type VI secretion protein [Mesorhizobium sp. M1B.F.Ca.ET.045.04.1.1]TIV60206.1 MAG: type VI secretion protein [Mesorhizobium sp.]TKB10568.1 MAG: type VI secretion protein [Mesorhizobium sp.]
MSAGSTSHGGEDEYIESYPVILALTRPPTVMGIPYTYFLAECFISLMLFMILGSILWFPISFVVCHSILYVLTVKLDLWFFDIVGRLSKCGVNPLGRKLGGGVRTYGV